MGDSTNVFLKKISDSKYELISKNLDLEQGDYSLTKVEELWILKQVYSSKDSENKEDVYNRGYIIFENEYQTKKFVEQYKEDIKKQKLVGIKGFDNKFYIFSSTYYIDLKNKILKSITENTSIEELATSTIENTDIIRGVIELLKEDGVIFEKTKDFFTKI